MITLQRFKQKRQPHREAVFLSLKKPKPELLLQIMFLNKRVDDFLQVGLADFLQVVMNARVGFFNFDQTIQIDRRANHHRIALGVVDGSFEVFELLLTISHGWQQRADIGINLKRFAEFANCVGTRVDHFGSANLSLTPSSTLTL